MTVFIRVLDEPVDMKASALRGAVLGLCTNEGPVVELDPEAFSAVPGSPFAYWLSARMRGVFRRLRPFEDEDRFARKGLSTDDDFRFIRCHWEVDSRENRWPALLKGGKRSPFFADIPASIKWFDNGKELKAFTIGRYGNAGKRVFNEEHYLREGLTWPLRGIRFSASAVPPGCVFSGGGKMAFGPSAELLIMLALFNSLAFDSFLRLFAGKVGGVQYESGLIGRVPYPEITEPQRRELVKLARRAWSRRRKIASYSELSYAFVLPAGLNGKVASVDRSAAEREIELIQKQIDDQAFELYGISAEDLSTVDAPTEVDAINDEPDTQDAKNADDCINDDSDEDESLVETDALFSWLVGVSFGRFDPRLATGERAIPPEPEPFDPLPLRSPGMYPEGEEPADGTDILVDDEGHPDDLAARTVTVADRVKVNVPENLRSWLAKEFFPLHIKMYSKSRRKAPIYWQLATPSASYSVWLYIHAFSKDTLFRVQNDYVGGERGKLAHEERRLESLTNELRNGATAAQRKQLAAQEALVEELRTFLDEVKRVAPLWNPNLDDGVIINFAPLWRLVPQNKSWQKELKSTWDALCEGKYDWAHLAMHLWPERVVPKCAKDRSLAIAHGLESVFWRQESGKKEQEGKWVPIPDARDLIPDLVRDRTSPAVKSALTSLLDVPNAATNAKKKGRARA